MNLWMRLLKVLIASFFRPRLGVGEESVLNFMVWPTDLDINVHMNNARYVALMDLGRLDIIMRSGLGRLVIKEHLQPVIASTMVRFRRSLLPFDRFILRSQVIAWDEKWMFIIHRLERRGEVVCQAVVKGLFLGANGGVPPQRLAELQGFTGTTPTIPQWILDWQSVEAAQIQHA